MASHGNAVNIEMKFHFECKTYVAANAFMYLYHYYYCITFPFLGLAKKQSLLFASKKIEAELRNFQKLLKYSRLL